MSVTIPTMTATTDSARSRSLLRSTLAIGVASAAVTTAVAAVLHAAGVSFTVDGEMIPLAGFAQLTFVGAVIGGLMLAVVNRGSGVPRPGGSRPNTMSERILR